MSVKYALILFDKGMKLEHDADTREGELVGRVISSSPASILLTLCRKNDMQCLLMGP